MEYVDTNDKRMSERWRKRPYLLFQVVKTKIKTRLKQPSSHISTVDCQGLGESWRLIISLVIVFISSCSLLLYNSLDNDDPDG